MAAEAPHKPASQRAHLLFFCKSGRHRSVAISHLILHILRDKLGMRVAGDVTHFCSHDWERLSVGPSGKWFCPVCCEFGAPVARWAYNRAWEIRQQVARL